MATIDDLDTDGPAVDVGLALPEGNPGVPGPALLGHQAEPGAAGVLVGGKLQRDNVGHGEEGGRRHRRSAAAPQHRRVRVVWTQMIIRISF